MKIHEGKCTEKILKERERIGSRLAILRKKRNMFGASGHCQPFRC